MSEESPEVRAVRIPLMVWNAACRHVGSTAELTGAEWAGLRAAGLAGPDDEIDARWRGLIHDYLVAPTSLQCVAGHNGLLYRSALAIGTTNICVLERFTTERAANGALVPVAHDELLEVAVTRAHPWLLLRRVLPPLDTLRAPSRQTGEPSAAPVSLDPATAEWLRSRAAEIQGPELIEELKQRASGPLRGLLESEDASVAYVLVNRVGKAIQVAAAWYLASAHSLYRATFAPEPPFEQVRPGDLAFTFDWHLLGALDARGVRAN